MIVLGAVFALAAWGTGTASRAAHPPSARRLEGIPRLSHIFIIVLENESYRSSWGAGSPARYLNSLRSRGTLLTQYYGVGHASNDNYIAMTSGQPPTPLTEADCRNWQACVRQDSSARYGHGVSIADQLQASGHTWKAYMGGMVRPCTHASARDVGDPYGGDGGTRTSPNYADRHNPFIYYAPIVNNAARCAAHVVPYSRLPADIAANRAPNYAFIVPDTCNDGHDNPCAGSSPGGLPRADAWLKANAPRILTYLHAHRGLLMITFDEAAGSDTSGCCGGGAGGRPGFGGRVGLLAISPFVRPGATNSTPYDHDSLLRTVEDAFGISKHLNNAGAKTERAMRALFTSGK